MASCSWYTAIQWTLQYTSFHCYWYADFHYYILPTCIGNPTEVLAKYFNFMIIGPLIAVEHCTMYLPCTL